MRTVYNRQWRITGKFFSRIRKYLSLREEYDKVRVVCGTQNCLRMRGKFLNFFREYEGNIKHM
jgi:hypothetical protein